VRKINYPHNEDEYRNERKHFDPRYGYQRPYTNQVRTFRPDGNYNTYSQYYLEDEMTRKKRIPNMDVQRNSLALGIPGDKFYRNTECTDGFYKKEGVAVGSTFYYEKEKNKLGKTLSRKACSFFDTCDMNSKTLNPEKLWKNKVMNEQFTQDSFYVKTVTQWDKTFMKTVQPPVTKASKTPRKTVVVNKASKKPVIVKK
jgi:hypothetical protein